MTSAILVACTKSYMNILIFLDPLLCFQFDHSIQLPLELAKGKSRKNALPTVNTKFFDAVTVGAPSLHGLSECSRLLRTRKQFGENQMGLHAHLAVR